MGGGIIEVPAGHKAGFVAIIGRPNVGKSTLVNACVGRKVAAVSPKPQTTRNRIAGVKTTGTYQIIFLDTPGIHHAETLFNREMVRLALKTLEEVDLILWMMDASDPLSAEDQQIRGHLRGVQTPVVIALNKVDLVRAKHNLLPLIDECQKLMPSTEVIPVSATEGVNMDRLEEVLLTHLPGAPRFFPPEQATDQPQYLLVAEIIREKVFQLMHQEIPYAVAVLVDEMKEREGEEIVDIQATIYVEKDSQKGIIIGTGGQMLKTIGQQARQEIERILGTRVYLGLWVKIRKAWRKDEEALRRFGYLHKHG
ncbi:MAG: GTPase Era [Candidatus Methylomirabilales bacterium]